MRKTTWWLKREKEMALREIGKLEIEGQLWREEDESTREILHTNLGHRALFSFLIFKDIFVQFCTFNVWEHIF